MDLTKLTPEDRSDFESRLARLGLDLSAVDDDPLEVESGKNLRLEMAGESPVSPMIFETKDIDTLRRWIGTPDRAIKSRTTQPFEPIIRSTGFAADVLSASAKPKRRRSKSAKASAVRLSGTLADLTKVEPKVLLESVNRAKAEPDRFRLKSDEVETIRAAARNFIHGDLKLVEGFKPVIEAFFGEFQIAVWLKTRIVVKRNSTLTLGAGVHNMTAYELVIEPGGRIRSHGHLTVSMTKIRRPAMVNPGLVLPNHVLTVNTLPRDPIFP